MNRASAKAKGHKLEAIVRDKVIEAFSLTRDDVRISVGSETGVDIKLSPKAKALFPFAPECKARAKMDTLYNFYDQAIRNADKLIPILVLKADYKQPLVVIDLDYFLTLVNK